MAETRITDVVVPEVFAPYIQEQSILKNAFIQAGVLVRSSAIDSLIAGGGETFNIPFFKELSGDSEVPSETVAVTINNITTGKQIGRRQFRAKSWGSNDLAAALAGSDPIAAIGNQVSTFWAADLQKNVVNSIKGVIADNVANDSGDLVVDIAIEDGDSATSANKFSTAEAHNALFKMGDKFDKFAALCVHSVVYHQMVDNNMIDYSPDSEQKFTIPMFQGLRVIVDDNVPVVAGGTSGYKYYSIFFESGAFTYGENNASIIPVETDRIKDKGMGIDVLHTRKQFVVHPNGFAWQEDSVAGVSPTFAELATASNWDRTFEKKNIGMTVLITNG